MAAADEVNRNHPVGGGEGQPAEAAPVVNTAAAAAADGEAPAPAAATYFNMDGQGDSPPMPNPAPAQPPPGMDTVAAANPWTRFAPPTQEVETDRARQRRRSRPDDGADEASAERGGRFGRRPVSTPQVRTPPPNIGLGSSADTADMVAALRQQMKLMAEDHARELSLMRFQMESLKGQATRARAIPIEQEDEDEEDDDNPLRPLDVKDMKKPSEFDGDAIEFPSWHERFKSLLVTRDHRWKELFAAIEGRLTQRIESVEKFRMEILGEYPKVATKLLAFSEQLYSYLMSYSKGTLYSRIIKAKAKGILEVYRDIVHEGKHLSKGRVVTLNATILEPKRAKDEKEVKSNLAEWKHQRQQLLDLGQPELPEDLRKTIFMKIVPDAYLKHMREQYGKVSTCYEFEQEFFGEAADRANAGALRGDGHKHIGALETTEANAEEEYEEVNVWSCEWNQYVCGLMPKRQRTDGGPSGDVDMAQANRSPQKGNKGGAGKGKQGQKDKKEVQCWSCGGPHFQRNCPHAAANPTPIPAAWSSWGRALSNQFPGPGTQQWNAWIPKGKGKGKQQKGKGKGKGGGKNMGEVAWNAPQGQATPWQGGAWSQLGQVAWGGYIAGLTKCDDDGFTPVAKGPKSVIPRPSDRTLGSFLSQTAFQALEPNIIVEVEIDEKTPENANKHHKLPVSKQGHKKQAQKAKRAKQKAIEEDKELEKAISEVQAVRSAANMSAELNPVDKRVAKASRAMAETAVATLVEALPAQVRETPDLSHLDWRHCPQMPVRPAVPNNDSPEGQWLAIKTKTPGYIDPYVLAMRQYEKDRAKFFKDRVDAGLGHCTKPAFPSFPSGVSSGADSEDVAIMEDVMEPVAESVEDLELKPVSDQGSPEERCGEGARDDVAFVSENSPDERGRRHREPSGSVPDHDSDCEGVAQVDGRRIASGDSWVAGGSRPRESRGKEKDWTVVAASLPENCTLLIYNYINGDVDEQLREARENDIRTMTTSLAHMIWTLPGPLEPDEDDHATDDETEEDRQCTREMIMELDRLESSDPLGSSMTSEKQDDIIKKMTIPGEGSFLPADDGSGAETPRRELLEKVDEGIMKELITNVDDGILDKFAEGNEKIEVEKVTMVSDSGSCWAFKNVRSPEGKFVSPKFGGFLCPVLSNDEFESEAARIRELCMAERMRVDASNGQAPVRLLVDDKPINNVNESQLRYGGWQLLSIAIDSGAAETVIPHKLVGQHPIGATRDSLSGLCYASATGQPIPNLGEQKLPLLTMEGTMRGMTFQAAPVSKPLGSVKRICAANHRVVFDDDGSYIENKASGEINWLREEEGNYVLDMWIIPPEEIPTNPDAGFGWQP